MPWTNAGSYALALALTFSFSFPNSDPHCCADPFT
jgi:hypothetical protein